MRIILYVSWCIAVSIGCLALAVFTAGVLRDQRVGEARIALNLADTSAWTSDRFRVWRGDLFRLALSSVNHTPPFGQPYRGTLEVEVRAPGGVPFHRATYIGEATDHFRPDNLSWTFLDSLQLPGTRAGRWNLSVRIAEADSHFSGVATTLHLRRERPDPGMGGLINYVMLFPAMFLLLISFVIGIALARGGGSSIPLMISAAALAALAGTFLIR